ncbi:SGCD (predicted) [Pycnogonum litorale]
MVMVIINLALTIWIIKVMDFSIDGMGRLRITNEGVRLEGESEFLKSLYASKIESRKEEALSVESANNLTLRARNRDGDVTNTMFLGQSIFETTADRFTVKNKYEELLFQADDNEITIATDTVRLTGPGGAVFDGSIQTPIVKSGPFQQLRLESPTRKIKLSAPEGVSIVSRVGDITASCLYDLYLQSTDGSISLNSAKIEMKNVPVVEARRHNEGHFQRGIFQLCSCENGRLFLSHPEDRCQADSKVCK